MNTGKKFHILAIAPYEELCNLIMTVAQENNEISLQAYTADLEQGVELVKKFQNQGFDAIISRGGTAQLIEEVALIPVIEIPIGGYDMLRVIRMAQAYNGKFAIVGFSSFVHSAKLICDTLCYDIDIIKIDRESEVGSCVSRLNEQGYRLIVGDHITTIQASLQGLNVLLVSSGTESIKQAFDQAIRLSRLFQNTSHQSSFHADLLQNCGASLVVYDANGQDIYCNISKLEISPIADLMKKHIPTVLEKGHLRLAKQLKQYSWTIEGHRQYTQGIEYAVYYIQKNHHIFGIEKSIQYYNCDELSLETFKTFYSSSESIAPIVNMISHYSTSFQPVLLLGESGSGKDAVAEALYFSSLYNMHPLIILDSELISDKNWDYLFENNKSPLAETQNTIYFKNAHLLSNDIQKKLEYYIHYTALQKRNRLLFSWIIDETDRNNKFFNYLNNRLSCLVLDLPPLRKRAENIPVLASLYLNKLNQQLAKQVIGFEPKALLLLSQYSWINNLDQFKHVLKHLVILTDGFYIQTELVASILEKEDTKYGTHGIDGSLLKGTLDKIEREIILRVLEEENQNQTKTANRLGISRSTMWRKLKEI